MAMLFILLLVVWFYAISADDVPEKLQFCFPEMALGSVEFKALCFNCSQHFIQAVIVLLSVGPKDEDVVHYDHCPFKALEQGTY